MRCLEEPEKQEVVFKTSNQQITVFLPLLFFLFFLELIRRPSFILFTPCQFWDWGETGTFFSGDQKNPTPGLEQRRTARRKTQRLVMNKYNSSLLIEVTQKEVEKRKHTDYCKGCWDSRCRGDDRPHDDTEGSRKNLRRGSADDRGTKC